MCKGHGWGRALVVSLAGAFLISFACRAFSAPVGGPPGACAPFFSWICAQTSPSQSQGTAGGTAPSRSDQPVDLRGGGAVDFQSLIELITQTIAPESWQDAGGAGTIQQFPGGVFVDAEGVLRFRKVSRAAREARQLERLREAARPSRRGTTTGSASVASPMRKVSLTRLERAVARRIAAGLPPTEEMRFLAGLTEARRLFVFPDSGDLVIAGPAEPWRADESGAFAWGAQSGSPVLQLDDFVTLLRVVEPGGPGVFACDISPTREGLHAVQRLLQTTRVSFTATGRERFLRELSDALGVQRVQIWGVPTTSRVASVIVAADYHMKLVGIGLVDGGKNVPSYLDMLRIPPSGVLPPLETLRWWFVPEYDEIAATASHDAFELRGTGVRVMAENEFLAEGGRRVRLGTTSLLNRQFARNFSEHFDELAARYPVYAELRNIFDLTTIASLVVNYELDSRVGWRDHGVFARDGAYQPAQWATPRVVESVVNQRVLEQRRIEGRQIVRRRILVTVISGGVVVNPWPLVKRPARVSRRPADAAPALRLPADPERWWWD